ncbi:malonate transporter subunit MadM [Algoriphagus kandeliae]|uniref:Malonate transporter subunit MadM n=1 Tax=Algoriphagus kandeliae TaxID=2562278 RepID=A0A4Y9QTR1_9BACT|nr:malonate transporter subunit MadM [Algoriphagus kandeliae]TFV94536.1 malonate transporter subunit MadM [Algoriphagus kandeliae]
MDNLIGLIEKNGLIFGFLCVGIIFLIGELLSKTIFRSKIPGSAIAIFLGLLLGYLGGLWSDGEKGIAGISLFAGIGLLGGSMFRDFTIVATALGANLELIRKAGWLGLISLLVGIVLFFIIGVLLAFAWGFRDAASLCTIGAGACTYIVGPITGAAVGASSEVIALSIAIGVVKTIAVTIFTPIAAKRIGLKSPESAMAFGGMMGTSSGVAAGLAATDPSLVPYGAVTATFYTGVGCLLCPSLFYLILNFVF